MENLLKVKLDDARKNKAIHVFSKNNLSLPSAIKLLLTRFIENE